MSNIFNHNRNIFDVKLNRDTYWDFHLCIDNIDYSNNNKCLLTYIDSEDDECIWFDNLYSKPSVTWNNAINNGLNFKSIGFTGIDNGLIKYEKDKITNKEFINLFLHSDYKIDSNNTRLVLNKVSGNNQIYDYSNDITFFEDKQVIKLNGGFYQGFFMTNCNEYQILPFKLEDEWHFEFNLYKEDFINQNYTLNDKHPENKGMFFYLGTRAENKWYKRYIITDPNVVISEESYSNEFFYKEQNINTSYLQKEVTDEKYFSDDYLVKSKKDNYYSPTECCPSGYVVPDYLEEEIKLDNNIKIETEEGYNLYQPNIIEFKTDNKFITFNNTCDGFTAKDDINNDTVILYDIITPNMDNYFLLFNNTCEGYTTKTIDKLINVKNKEYSVLKDIFNNCLGFQIKDDGSIGYKYLVKDCESEVLDYKIETEFSHKGVINDKKWVRIDIKLQPIPNKKMRILIYIENKLKLVSKELPLLNLRKLNDLYSKQEGVPFNISIGGGTQGLCDMVDINYMTPPTDILPIEKEFGGSFIGYIKTFKFHKTC